MALPHEVLHDRIERARPALHKVINRAGEILEASIRSQAGLEDHTLKELRKMGHPYRMREGGFWSVTVDKAGEAAHGAFVGPIKGKWRAGIRKAARVLREGLLGHDIKLVHIQSESLINAIHRETIDDGQQIRSRIWVDEGAAPWVRWVVLGTTRMIPRDFIGIGAVRARSAIFETIRVGIAGAFYGVR